MLKGIESKNLLLIYAVIGFGSIALVALGELSGAEAGSVLYDFYLRLVFGGFLIFYAVLFHFAMLPYSSKLDDRNSWVLKALFGERSSRILITTLVIGVLLYWIFAFSVLMSSTDFRLF